MVNTARKVGRSDAIKKRDMIAGSKRRKQKAQIINNIKQNDADDSE